MPKNLYEEVQEWAGYQDQTTHEVVEEYLSEHDPLFVEEFGTLTAALDAIKEWA